MTQSDRASAWDALAAECERATALMTAGLPTSMVWSTVFDAPHVTPSGAVSAVAADRQLVAGAWAASLESGAPVSVTLLMLAQTYRAIAQIEREVDAATAGPRMATRVMLTLPAIGVLLAGALGMNVLTFFVSHALGVACLVSGVALVSIGWWWSRRLVRHISIRSVPRGVVATVVVAGLRVGVAITTSLDALTQHLGADHVAREIDHIHRLQTFSSTWGMPLADVLLAETTQARDAGIARVRRDCAELAERLLIPLGACVLPAFVVLSVVPIVVELISASGIARVVT